MDKEQQRMAKQQLAMLMEQRMSWKEATATVGLPISRSTAYRWLKAWRTRGEDAFHERRHGHLVKLREPVATVLETLCQHAPEMPSREVEILFTAFSAYVFAAPVVQASGGPVSLVVSREAQDRRRAEKSRQ